jgi:hypothetical protein
MKEVTVVFTDNTRQTMEVSKASVGDKSLIVSTGNHVTHLPLCNIYSLKITSETTMQMLKRWFKK